MLYASVISNFSELGPGAPPRAQVTDQLAFWRNAILRLYPWLWCRIVILDPG